MKKNLRQLKPFKKLKGRLLIGVPMKRHTTMRIGGPARALFIPDNLIDLIEAIRLCRRIKIPVQVIGMGSNIIVPDAGTKKILIRLSSSFFKKIAVCENNITCGAGVGLNKLSLAAEENGLGGSEFLVGIPGTVGGAVIQNAGAQKRSISDIIKDVRVLDKNGKAGIIGSKGIRFGYRKSSLDGLIVIGATFRLKKDKKLTIRKKTNDFIRDRLAAQDYTFPSAGCIFKNTKSTSAGELIERCGLKGKARGGALISKKHANFIINKRNAKASDILWLIDSIKKSVKKEFNINLKEEIRIIR